MAGTDVLTMDQILGTLEDIKNSLGESVEKVSFEAEDDKGNKKTKYKTVVNIDKMKQAQGLIDRIFEQLDNGIDLSVEEIGQIKSAFVAYSRTIQKNLENQFVSGKKDDKNPAKKENRTVLEDMAKKIQPLINELTATEKAINEYTGRGYDINDHIAYEMEKVNGLESEKEQYETEIENMEEAVEEVFGNLLELYDLEANRNEILTSLKESYDDLGNVIKELEADDLTPEDKKRLEEQKEQLVDRIKGLQDEYKKTVILINKIENDPNKKREEDIEEFNKNPEEIASSGDLRWIESCIKNTENEMQEINRSFKEKMEKYERMDENDVPEQVKKIMEVYNDSSWFKGYNIGKLYGSIRKNREEIKKINERMAEIKGTIKKLGELERVSVKKKTTDSKTNSGSTGARKQGVASKPTQKEKEEINKIYENLFSQNVFLTEYKGKGKMSNEMLNELREVLKNTVYKDSKNPERAAKRATRWGSKKRALKKVKKEYMKMASEQYAEDKKKAAKANKAKVQTMAEKYRVEGVQIIKTQAKNGQQIDTQAIKRDMYDKFDRDL